MMQSQCPITHKLLSEIQMPLGIKGHAGVVYEGEDLLKWLTEYQFKNPCTNEPMKQGMATDLLEAKLLPHTTPKQYLHAIGVLFKLGFLRGPRIQTTTIRRQTVPLGLLQLWLRLTWLWFLAALLLPYVAGSSWAVMEVMSFLGLWCFRPTQARSLLGVFRDLLVECISMSMCLLVSIGLMRLLLGSGAWYYIWKVTCNVAAEVVMPPCLQSAVQRRVCLIPTLLNVTLEGCP
jgi:hypothetical protein